MRRAKHLRLEDLDPRLWIAPRAWGQRTLSRQGAPEILGGPPVFARDLGQQQPGASPQPEHRSMAAKLEPAPCLRTRRNGVSSESSMLIGPARDAAGRNRGSSSAAASVRSPISSRDRSCVRRNSPRIPTVRRLDAASQKLRGARKALSVPAPSWNPALPSGAIGGAFRAAASRSAVRSLSSRSNAGRGKYSSAA